MCPPPPPQDNRLTAILDSIIARVVERKIQERHGGTPRPSPPLGTPTSHRVLTPGGLLWLQDPPHATSYALFQQHWRQGQVRPPPHNAQTPPPMAKPTH